jgi:UDP-N-acetylglucosamine acyltransferase
MDRTSIGRGVLLAGHIVVQTGAVIAEMTGVHHFSRIGRFCRVGPRTPVRRDVPPFTDFYSEDYYWDPPMVRGLHEAGLAAANLSGADEAQLRKALQWLFDDESAMATKIEQIAASGPMAEELAYVCQFCRESLDGLYGRYRERFRGQLPPEAHEVLGADLLETIQRKMACR